MFRQALIWVLTVCKGYQLMTQVGKELILDIMNMILDYNTVLQMTVAVDLGRKATKQTKRRHDSKLFGICCGYSKELSQSDCSFEHPKQMLKLIDRKILIIFTLKNVYLDNKCIDVPKRKDL